MLEAMKMQSEIRAPCSGRVVTVAVRAGQEVMGGAVLAVIEPTG
ncbi:MAG TPA: biotin/lipoyl-containing protein [bacterium]|nr:biotin/lipoyl-containing protein [bacterium]